jgi:catabolite regulation protein CreA
LTKIKNEEEKFNSEKSLSFKKLNLLEKFDWNSYDENNNTKIYVSTLLNNWKGVKKIIDF